MDCPDHTALGPTITIGGFELQVLDIQTVIRQRGPVHHFAGRDDPLAEFLGREARRYSITAYINGADVWDQTRRFQKIAEDPCPKTISHPKIGSESVKLESVTFDADVENSLFEVSVRIEAVEAGNFSFPIGIFPFGQGVFDAVVGLRDQLQTSFDDIFDVSSLPTYLSNQILGVASEAGALFRNGMLGLVNWTSATSDTQLALLRLTTSPDQPLINIGQSLIDASQAIGLDYVDGRKSEAVRRLGKLARFRPATQSVRTSSPKAAAAQRSLDSIIATGRVAAASEQARLIFEDDAYFTSYTEALTYQGQMEILLADEMKIAISNNDNDLFIKTADLMKAIADSVDQLAPRLPTRQTFNLCRSRSLAQAAYLVYGPEWQNNISQFECANTTRSAWILPPTVVANRAV